ncbi:hypothetical protein [Thalassorhabdomicrobium marinisediminis]|uniref:hypothetical protein n=1 Tax=Thalassorhabdomicrobium marinisediminis TaxID=2170577 RepID=UPI003CD0DE84
MHHPDLSSFLTAGVPVLTKGPVALIFAEDEVALDATIRHHLAAGFRHTVVFAMPEFAIAEDVADRIIRVSYSLQTPDALEMAMNSTMKAAGDIWFYYCFNAEFLFYPFSEHRSVGEMITFNVEERRDTILTYVVDLYTGDLWQHPNAVCLEDAHLDKTGYYALARKDRWNNVLDRQLDFFGGLRWRFEEHIPAPRRRIDRVALFRNKPGLVFRSDHTFNDPEYNTYACPWHHNLTAAICSFRTAKALKRNPGSTFDIETFKWHNSTPFEWHSQQLLDLGLIEPGQWF